MNFYVSRHLLVEKIFRVITEDEEYDEEELFGHIKEALNFVIGYKYNHGILPFLVKHSIDLGKLLQIDCTYTISLDVLSLCCLGNKIEFARKLIEVVQDIYPEKTIGTTATRIAFLFSRFDMVRLFLEYDFDVENVYIGRKHALRYLAEADEFDLFREVLDRWRDEGIYHRGAQFADTFEYCITEQKVEYFGLLVGGGYVNTNSFLHTIFRYGTFEMLEMVSEMIDFKEYLRGYGEYEVISLALRDDIRFLEYVLEQDCINILDLESYSEYHTNEFCPNYGLDLNDEQFLLLKDHVEMASLQKHC